MKKVGYSTIALAKGRPADKTMKMSEAVGISCDEMRDRTSRKLIFVNEDLRVRFFPVKVSDVPTHVEYGATDIRAVGRDTILEKDRKLYEATDLGAGKCRMCFCELESARERLEHHELIQVATKYPNIIRDCSYSQKCQTVGITKLNGSIELAPIVGLSEVIADIVETGSILRENGPIVSEEVCSLSARVVANQVSMKTKNEHITTIIKKLQTCLGENAGR